jgi:hypothetical protein
MDAAEVFSRQRIETLLHGIRVVASLQPHEKLSVNSAGELSVDVPSTAAPFLRTLRGDSRLHGISTVDGIVNELAALLRTEADRSARGATGIRAQLQSWTHDMYLGTAGLRVLAQTYHGDSSTVSRIAALQRAIEAAVTSIERRLGQVFVEKGCTVRDMENKVMEAAAQGQVGQ